MGGKDSMDKNNTIILENDILKFKKFDIKYTKKLEIGRFGFQLGVTIFEEGKHF